MKKFMFNALTVLVCISVHADDDRLWNYLNLKKTPSELLLNKSQIETLTDLCAEFSKTSKDWNEKHKGEMEQLKLSLRAENLETHKQAWEKFYEPIREVKKEYTKKMRAVLT